MWFVLATSKVCSQDICPLKWESANMCFADPKTVAPIPLLSFHSSCATMIKVKVELLYLAMETLHESDFPQKTVE